MATVAKNAVLPGAGARNEIDRRSAIRSSRCKAADNARKLRRTERDLWIIEALAKMRFLETSQLAALFFNESRWSANKRLRRLLDSGLIKAWVMNLAQENLYSITSDGLNWLGQEECSLTTESRCPKRLDENLDHLLAINDVRISLALGLSKMQGELLWWRSDWELRAHGRERIIPDGLCSIRWDGLHQHAYGLEVDNNTKSSRNFLRKLLAYESLQNRGETIYGIAAPIILVAGAHPRWLERYRLSVGNVGLEFNVWFATLDEIRASGALNSIWKAADGEKKYSLRELTLFPYRKEREASLTDNY